MNVRGRFHSHEEVIHGNDGPSRLIFTLLLGNVVMGATSFPSCSVRTSLETVRVLLHAPLSPFALVCSWALPSLANLALPTPPRRQSHFLLHVTSHHVLLQLHSILSLRFVLLFHSLLSHLCTMLPALQACRKLLDDSLSLPAENWTCFIEAHPHVHCEKP